MNSLLMPAARKQGLVVQDMPEEVLIYDLKSDKAHCLNKTAAFVWKSCDGKNSIADITRLFSVDAGKQVQEDLVWLAVEQLNEKQLLEKDIATKFKGQSRRQAIKKIGFAAVVALPIVASLTAPTAALAVVCSGTVSPAQCATCNPGTPCTTCTPNPCPAGQSCKCSGVGTCTCQV